MAETPLLLAWRERTGKHTSSYIDNADWKLKISDAGATAMETIGGREWNSSRWAELIEKSLVFATESGLENNASRSEIIDLVNEAIIESGFSDRITALLCMLGESIVIVPNHTLDEGGWVEELSSLLERNGFSTFPSRIGSMR